MPRNAGFSLLEIVVAVSVLSILAAVLVPVVSGIVDDSRFTEAESDLEAIRKAYQEFYADTGSWPGNGTGTWSENNYTDTLGDNNYVLFSNGGDLAGWDGPYLEGGAAGADGASPAFTDADDEEGLLDPWGQRYRVSGFAPGTLPEAPFGALVLYSRGPNDAKDTSDNDMVLGKATGDDVVTVVTVKP